MKKLIIPAMIVTLPLFYGCKKESESLCIDGWSEWQPMKRKGFIGNTMTSDGIVVHDGWGLSTFLLKRDDDGAYTLYGVQSGDSYYSSADGSTISECNRITAMQRHRIDKDGEREYQYKHNLCGTDVITEKVPDSVKSWDYGSIASEYHLAGVAIFNDKRKLDAYTGTCGKVNVLTTAYGGDNYIRSTVKHIGKESTGNHTLVDIGSIVSLTTTKRPRESIEFFGRGVNFCSERIFVSTNIDEYPMKRIAVSWLTHKDSHPSIDFKSLINSKGV